MDREIRFVHPHRVYIVRWAEQVTPASVYAHWQALMEDPEYVPGYAALHDGRGCRAESQYADLTAGEATYRKQVAPRVGEGNTALLVDSEVIYGLARQITILFQMEDSSLVTYDPAEAMAFVGLPPDFELA